LRGDYTSSNKLYFYLFNDMATTHDKSKILLVFKM